MFQWYCSFMVGQFLAKRERSLYLLYILKKVQTQHPTAARRLKPDFCPVRGVFAWGSQSPCLMGRGAAEEHLSGQDIS